MNFRKIVGIIPIVAMLLMTSCTQVVSEVSSEEKVKLVRVEEIIQEVNPKIIEYLGTVTSESVKDYSFKVGGRVEEIYVKVGDQVKSGDPLVGLNTKDLSFQTEATKKQMEALKASYKKAQNGTQAEDIKNAQLNVDSAQKSVNLISSNYDKNSKLYEMGALSEKDLDQIKLQKEQAEIQLEQAKQQLLKANNGARDEDVSAAKAQYEASIVQYEANNNMLQEATLYSNMEGFVVEVLKEDGEMIGAGYPVIIVRNDEQIVEIGVTQQDVKKLKIGQDAVINVDEVHTNGEIIKISQLPDRETRTYKVQLKINDKLTSNQFLLGSIATVDFEMGNMEGIWLDIQSILNDGEDYVFVIKDERGTRRNIKFLAINENKVLVEGLEAGDMLIVEGMKSLKEGFKVKIISE